MVIEKIVTQSFSVQYELWTLFSLYSLQFIFYNAVNVLYLRFVYNQKHISNYKKYHVKWFQRLQTLWLLATKNILRLRLSKRKKTGSVMFVYVEGFLQGVWTLLSFTVHSTENCFVRTAWSFVYAGVPDIGMARGPKTPTDPPHFFLIYKPSSCIFGIQCHQCTRCLHRTNWIYFVVLLPSV